MRASEHFAQQSDGDKSASAETWESFAIGQAMEDVDDGDDTVQNRKKSKIGANH